MHVSSVVAAIALLGGAGPGQETRPEATAGSGGEADEPVRQDEPAPWFLGVAERVSDLDRRGPDGELVVSDQEVSRLEEWIGRAFGVPRPWQVELRADDPGSAGTPAVARLTETLDGGRLLGCSLRAPGGIALPFHTAENGKWVRLGGLLFIDEGGHAAFSREQYESRTGFFPVGALPHVLEALSFRVAGSPRGALEIGNVYLENGRPLADPPAASCAVELSSADGSFGAHVRGLLVLPEGARQPAGFAYRGSTGTGDSVIGPDTPSAGIEDAIDLAARLRAACPRSAHLDYFAWVAPGLYPVDLWIRFEPPDGGTAWSLAMPVHFVEEDRGIAPTFGLAPDESSAIDAESFRGLVALVEASTVDRGRDLFGLVHAGRPGELILLSSDPSVAEEKERRWGFRPAPAEVAVQTVRIHAGAPPSISEPIVSALATRRSSQRTVAAVECEERGLIEIAVHDTVFCAVGYDLSELRTHATIQGRRTHFLGGSVERLRKGF